MEWYKGGEGKRQALEMGLALAIVCALATLVVGGMWVFVGHLLNGVVVALGLI